MQSLNLKFLSDSQSSDLISTPTFGAGVWSAKNDYRDGYNKCEGQENERSEEDVKTLLLKPKEHSSVRRPRTVNG